MEQSRRSRNVILAACAALLIAAFAAGGVVAGQFGGLEDPDDLAAAMREASVVRVAEVEASSGLPSRGVFVQTTADGLLCLFEAPSATSADRRGGCNDIEDPLGGAELSTSLSYEGGPSTTRVTDARLIGLVARQVASVQVLMSDGTRRPVPVRRPLAVATAMDAFRAFGYRFAPSDFAQGVEPAAVLALDSAGREIDRQTTGFGG